jgi:hypothetical protein
MENIAEPNDSFDFTKLSLGHPSNIQGGAYFTSIEYNNLPLYIQTTKSLSKQGIVRTGKKLYIDLMFDKTSETIINWFENLEETCKKLIYAKKEEWFQNSLEESDIDNAFNSIIRIYKSGKFYLVRSNVKCNQSAEPAVKLYNENEITMTCQDIIDDTEIISILEIKGIKFTTRNFQIDIEVKQIMILDNEPIFKNCVIKGRKPPNDKHTNDNDKPTNDNDKHPNDKPTNDTEFDVAKPKNIGFITNDKIVNMDNLEEIEDVNVNNKPLDSDMFSIQLEDNTQLKNITTPENITPHEKNMPDESVDLNFEIEELCDNIIEEEPQLQELEIDNANLDELGNITLKKPNQIYFELYKEARAKAKTAKKNAILAFLEAKNIKKTYMLDNLNEMDSDFDEEIDEVSESELEGL